jgi:hypothetical protein
MTHSGAVGTDLTKAKQPKVIIKVSYSAYETKGQNCLGEQGIVNFEVYLKGSFINNAPNPGLMGEGVIDIVTNYKLGFSYKKCDNEGCQKYDHNCVTSFIEKRYGIVFLIKRGIKVSVMLCG